MIDYIKCYLKQENINNLLESDLLDFVSDLSHKSGLIYDKLKANYNGLEFIIINNQKAIVRGSLHKYKNKGLHNFDDFTFSQLKEVLLDIKAKFGIELTDYVLCNIEIGINVTPPIKSSEILDNLLLHKGEYFKDKSLRAGNYKQAIHQRYLVKIYDKLLQYKRTYKLNNEIFRFEIKFVKMFDLKAKNIFTLQDLMNPNSMLVFGGILETEWIFVLLYDITIKENNLPDKIREVKLNQWKLNSYWKNLDKYKRYRERNYYEKLLENNSKEIHLEMSVIICEKLKFIIEN